MFQVRIHGRGGQGVVTAAEMLSVAAFDEGRHAQAFPSFGSERMGAPVVSFCRIDDRTIRVREPIASPDALIVQDPTLLHQVDVFGGLEPRRLRADQHHEDVRRARPRGLGRQLPPRALPDGPGQRARPASISAGRSPNAALLGGFAAMTGVVSLGAVADAIRERFPGAIGDGNVAAATAAHAFVVDEISELANV